MQNLASTLDKLDTKSFEIALEGISSTDRYQHLIAYLTQNPSERDASVLWNADGRSHMDLGWLCHQKGCVRRDLDVYSPEQQWHCNLVATHLFMSVLENEALDITDRLTLTFAVQNNLLRTDDTKRCRLLGNFLDNDSYELSLQPHIQPLEVGIRLLSGIRTQQLGSLANSNHSRVVWNDDFRDGIIHMMAYCTLEDERDRLAAVESLKTSCDMGALNQRWVAACLADLVDTSSWAQLLIEIWSN